jgi:hypothetical protein
MNLTGDAISIFYSYSHVDELLRNELAKHLSIIERAGWIREWHDRKILPGDEWDKKISQYLEKADLILLLISSDFLSSSYCQDIETARAIELHEKGRARVVPVILRPVIWQASPLSRFQALPRDARPVTQWPDRDLAFVNICEGILAIVITWGTAGEAEVPSPASPRSTPLLDGISEARKRILDAALPARVLVNKTTVLAVMVRREQSSGLRRVLELDATYGVGAEDVRSTKSFPIRFVSDPDGVLIPVELVLKLESPDFEIALKEKSIAVPARGDSDPRVLLLTPLHEGELVVHLELWQNNSSIAQCLLRTNAVSDEAKVTRKQRLVSVPLDFGPSGVDTLAPTQLRPQALQTVPQPKASTADTTVEHRARAKGHGVVKSAAILFVIGALASLGLNRFLFSRSSVDLHITAAKQPSSAWNSLTVEGKASGPYKNIYILTRPVGASEFRVQRLSSPNWQGKWKTTVHLGSQVGIMGAEREYEVRAIATPDKLEDTFVANLPINITAMDRVTVKCPHCS